jgi:hypothetical protein
MSDPNTDREKKVSFIQVFQSTIAAAFGVQSDRNRQRDFKHGKPIHYIIAGLIFTLLFIATIVLVVQMVVPDQ